MHWNEVCLLQFQLPDRKRTPHIETVKDVEDSLSFFHRDFLIPTVTH